MLSLFSKTSTSIHVVQQEFNEVKRDFNVAFDLAKAQRDELLNTKARLEAVNHELIAVNEILATTNKLITEMSHAAGGLICRKDAEGKYLFVNEYQCANFFGMSHTCLDEILGLTDIDIINMYREKTGNEHTFGDVCVSTDQHCRKQGKRSLYVELGRVGGNEMALKVIKTPIFEPDGTYSGIVVFGWDVSSLCDGLIMELKKGLIEGTVEKLDENIYWIKDSHTCKLPMII